MTCRQPTLVTPVYHEGIFCATCTLRDIPEYDQQSYEEYVQKYETTESV